jgi:predicted nucleic acid-binding protein
VKVLFDTSVFVPAVIDLHPNHKNAQACFKRTLSKEWVFLISTHSLAECYTTLTNLPINPRISPSYAKQVIEINIHNRAEVISLSPSDYINTITRLADLNLEGGIIYDGLILKAAEKSHASVLLTYNTNDFMRLLPAPELKVASPDEFI